MTRKVFDNLPFKLQAGMRIGHLILIHLAYRDGKNGNIWTVKCDCGITTQMPETKLKNRHDSRSITCGCRIGEYRPVELKPDPDYEGEYDKGHKENWK